MGQLQGCMPKACQSTHSHPKDQVLLLAGLVPASEVWAAGILSPHAVSPSCGVYHDQAAHLLSQVFGQPAVWWFAEAASLDQP